MSDVETPSWGIERVPDGLRVLGFLDGFLLWANLSVSLLVIVAGAFLVLPTEQFGLALSLPVAVGAIVAAAIVGKLLLGLGGLIGADARAARTPWVISADRPEHPAVSRLVGLRADHHRHGRERPLEAGARVRRRRVMEGALRHRRDDPRVPRPGRLRAPVRPQVRDLERDRVAPLPRVVVAAWAASRCALAPPRRARVLAR